MKISLFILGYILIISSSLLFCQTEDKELYLLPSDQLMSMMENSQVVYEPHIEDNYVNNDKPNLPTLNNEYFLSAKDSTLYLQQYNLSEEGKKTFNLAEEAFINHDYDKGITLYRKVLDTDKEYNKVFTMIGDMYYVKKDYDSAKYYFKLSIEKNFVDYAAHWFLADTYNKLGEKEEALKQITIAHLLNRNHKSMYDRLKVYREALNRNWKEWEIAPQCSTYKEEDKVVIKCTPEWAGYAIAEALWKFEPGFSEGVCGRKYDGKDAIYQKEAGCLFANLSTTKNEDMVNIIKDGYFQEMVWYEVLSKRAPQAMLLIPETFLTRIVEYVDKFH